MKPIEELTYSLVQSRLSVEVAMPGVLDAWLSVAHEQLRTAFFGVVRAAHGREVAFYQLRVSVTAWGEEDEPAEASAPVPITAAGDAPPRASRS